MRLLSSVLNENSDCQYLIHLGDEPDDLEYFPEFTEKMQVFSVYGLYHPKWRRSNACQTFTIENMVFHIAHSIEHLCVNSKHTIYCFGHTHHRVFEQNEKGVFINPGHLKNEEDRGEEAGYAVVELTDKSLVKFYNFKHILLSLNQIQHSGLC